MIPERQNHRKGPVTLTSSKHLMSSLTPSQFPYTIFYIYKQINNVSFIDCTFKLVCQPLKPKTHWDCSVNDAHLRINVYFYKCGVLFCQPTIEGQLWTASSSLLNVHCSFKITKGITLDRQSLNVRSRLIGACGKCSLH